MVPLVPMALVAMPMLLAFAANLLLARPAPSEILAGLVAEIDGGERQLQQAVEDPRYAFGESVITIWPTSSA